MHCSPLIEVEGVYNVNLGLIGFLTYEVLADEDVTGVHFLTKFYFLLIMVLDVFHL